MPPRPKYTPEISFGQLFQIFVVGIGFAASFVALQSIAQNNEAAIGLARTDRQALEVRVRIVETNQARSDERFSSILSLLGRIDKRLDVIEQAQ